MNYDRELALQLASEYRKNWISDDYQGKLERDDERPGFTPESPEITINENGQLFAVMAYYEMFRLNVLADESYPDFNHMMNNCRIIENNVCLSGLYYRRYLDLGRRQSHDNIIGLCAGSLLFGTNHAMLIAAHGNIYGWCFNVQNPRVWDIKCCIQGGDVAFVKICAGHVPTLWEMAWYMLGRMVVPHNAGKVNLSQIRFKAMELAEAKFKMPEWVWKMNAIAKRFFDFRHKRNGSFMWAIEAYFGRNKGPENPYIKLCEMCDS